MTVLVGVGHSTWHSTDWDTDVCRANNINTLEHTWNFEVGVLPYHLVNRLLFSMCLLFCQHLYVLCMLWFAQYEDPVVLLIPFVMWFLRVHDFPAIH